MIQLFPEIEINGVKVDVDITQTDYKGGRPHWRGERRVNFLVEVFQWSFPKSSKWINDGFTSPIFVGVRPGCQVPVVGH